MSEAKTTSIYQRLRSAQLELKAPKNEIGRFGKSRSAESILEAAKPVLAKHGLTLLVTDEVVEIVGRHYVKAMASVYDDVGASISATAHAWEGEVDRGLDTSQVTGKTSSYARKYALGGLLAIDDTKDADAHTDDRSAARPSSPVKAQVPIAKLITAAQAGMLVGIAKQASGLTERADIIAFIEEEAGKPMAQILQTEVEAIKAKLSSTQPIDPAAATREVFGDGVEVQT